MSVNPVRIAIFASGGGSNAREIVRHFRSSGAGEVVLLAANRKQSGIFQLGEEYQITCRWMPAELHQNGEKINHFLKEYGVELLVLAGYLKHIPDQTVQAFPERIVNIHPSLLPAYGGAGMYGMRVHEAVIAAGEQWSGLSIHFVNEVYDQGKIIFQTRVAVEEGMSAADLQKAVLKQEHTHFPRVIENICQGIRINKKL